MSAEAVTAVFLIGSQPRTETCENWELVEKRGRNENRVSPQSSSTAEAPEGSHCLNESVFPSGSTWTT